MILPTRLKVFDTWRPFSSISRFIMILTWSRELIALYDGLALMKNIKESRSYAISNTPLHASSIYQR
jgi:hypothetical protein